jgi:ubiquinone/menaquinone biosynthesis C-methylase UbiE
MSELGFDEAADFYRFRTPYNKNIFPQIAKALDCTSSTIILDLACGDGPLSHGISLYVGRVVALDSSAAMLAKARKAPKRYLPSARFLERGSALQPTREPRLYRQGYTVSTPPYSQRNILE